MAKNNKAEALSDKAQAKVAKAAMGIKKSDVKADNKPDVPKS